MSAEITGTTIKLTRGDSFYASVPLYIDEEETELYVPEEHDTVRFALKRRVFNSDGSEFVDDEPLLFVPLTYDSTSGLWDLHLVPSDTADLGFGNYAYDIQLSTTWDDTLTPPANTDDFTFIANAKLKLTPEVD